MSSQRRLQKEFRDLMKNQLEGIRALPSPSNLLEWHYVLEGDKDSDYGGGYYHGTIVFPQAYPFKPPSIQMLTPNGRFQTGTKLCLSMSDFHPESWNPLWGVSRILLGIQSFFYENAYTTGALKDVSSAEKKRLAVQSLDYNLRNLTYRKLFPDLVDKALERRKEIEKTAKRSWNNTSDNMNKDNNNNAPDALQPLHRKQYTWSELVRKDFLAAIVVLGIAMAIGACIFAAPSTRHE